MNIDPYVVGRVIANFYKAAVTSNDAAYSLSGRLQASDGQLVLTVPAKLIRGVFDAVDEPGMELPPRFQIVVISANELLQIGGLDKITERGHAFSYTIGPIIKYAPRRGLYSYAIGIKISSPDLQKLRRTYGLESTPSKGGFIIPVAMRRPYVLANNPASKIDQ